MRHVAIFFLLTKKEGRKDPLTRSLSHVFDQSAENARKHLHYTLREI